MIVDISKYINIPEVIYLDKTRRVML